VVEPKAVEQRLDAVLGERTARALVTCFFETAQPFAGHTFDDLGVNDPYRVTGDDIAAVTLLDVRLHPLAVRALLEAKAAAVTEHLRGIPDALDLWMASDEDLHRIVRFYDFLDRLPGVGETKATKVLARKRPRLVPIIDSVVRRALPLSDQPLALLQQLRAAMRDEERRQRVQELRPEWEGSAVTEMRLVDAAIWMQYSRSRYVRRCRSTLGTPEPT
jgi:hypothetical protein